MLGMTNAPEAFVTLNPVVSVVSTVPFGTTTTKYPSGLDAFPVENVPVTVTDVAAV